MIACSNHLDKPLMGKFTDGMNLAVILTNKNLTILPDTYCFQGKHKNTYNTCLLEMLASLNLPYMQYVLWLIGLVNWDTMDIGRHFSLANKAILSVYCFIIHTIISSVDMHYIWWSEPKSPNCQIKITTKCTTYIVWWLFFQYIDSILLHSKQSCVVDCKSSD